MYLLISWLYFRKIRGISADKITEEFVEAAKFGNGAKERKGEASFDRSVDRSVTWQNHYCPHFG